MCSLHLSQLLLDLDIDIALLQKPSAVSDLSPRLKYIPEGYVVLHNLSGDHAYGAAIIAKKIVKRPNYSS